jgi:hypothetical protein
MAMDTAACRIGLTEYENRDWIAFGKDFYEEIEIRATTMPSTADATFWRWRGFSLASPPVVGNNKKSSAQSNFNTDRSLQG